MRIRLGIAAFIILLFAQNAYSAITFFGQGHNPSANPGTGLCNDSGTPTSISPPASMAANDYVLLIAIAPDANASNPLVMSQAGGQTWTAETQVDQNDVTTGYQMHVKLWHTRFNGTWSADPAVHCTTASGDAFAIEMLVFRGVDTTTAVDVAASCAGQAKSGGSATNVTISAITTNTNNAMAVAFWTGQNVWTLQTGGWSQQQANWQNTSGGDADIAHAYKIVATAGTTGDVTNQEAAGTDPVVCIMALKPADAGSVPQLILRRRAQ